MRFGAPRLAAAGSASSHRKISVPKREIIRPADGRHSLALKENVMGRFDCKVAVITGAISGIG